MALIDALIWGLVTLGAAGGLAVLLVITGMIELRNPANNKILYSTLIIILLLLVLTLFGKAVFIEGEGFSFNRSPDSDDCKKPDPPFWCYLEADK